LFLDDRRHSPLPGYDGLSRLRTGGDDIIATSKAGSAFKAPAPHPMEYGAGFFDFIVGYGFIVGHDFETVTHPNRISIRQCALDANKPLSELYLQRLNTHFSQLLQDITF
jgi:hypothetical protein